MTATSVMMFEIVIGIITRNWLTAWMSVAERAISWPVWAWSWKAKWSRWRWAKRRWRSSVSAFQAVPNAW